MSIVSGLRKQRGFMVIEIDDAPCIKVPITVYRERVLQVGDPFDEASYTAWLMEREYPHALERAVRALSTRARTEQELSSGLARCGYSPYTIARVMQRLTEAGYVNDAVFADQWTLARTSRAMGKRRIAQELRQKGVDSQTIDAALEQIDEEDLFAAAKTLAQKLLARTRGRDDRDVQRKVIAALARRGYDYSTARHAIESVAEANDALDDDWPE